MAMAAKFLDLDWLCMKAAVEYEKAENVQKLFVPLHEEHIASYKSIRGCNDGAYNIGYGLVRYPKRSR